MRRYIKLHSVGTAIDRYTLDIFPILSTGNISFCERQTFKEITNPDWFTEMSNEDRQLLMGVIKAHKTLYDEAIETLHLLHDDTLEKVQS